MPFVSSWSGYAIIDDIVVPKKEGHKVIDKGNGLKPLEVTCGRECSYDSTDDKYKELVFRGTPQPKNIGRPGGMNWLDTPVFRAVTNRYKKKDWDRFLKHYIEHVNFSPDRTLWYEPDMIDIEIRDYDPIALHFPVDILKYITTEKVLFDNTLTIYDEAKNNSKVNMPNKPMFGPGQYEKLLKAIEHRIAAEKTTVKA